MAARSRAARQRQLDMRAPDLRLAQEQWPHRQPLEQRGILEQLRMRVGDRHRLAQRVRSGGSITADDPLDAGDGRRAQSCRRRRRCGQDLRCAPGGGGERGHVAGEEAGGGSVGEHRDRVLGALAFADRQLRRSREDRVTAHHRAAIYRRCRPASRSASSFVVGVPAAAPRTSSSSRCASLGVARVPCRLGRARPGAPRARSASSVSRAARSNAAAALA